MQNGALGLLGAAALATAVLAGATPRSWADGALAVGSTGNVVRDGIAFGMVVNAPKETAADTAVKRCRTFKARAAAERCRIVATFSGECFAVAYDPKSGTPGAGWGIGPDQLAANRRATAMCEETAGPARKGFCQVESAGCDTPEQTKMTPQDAAKTANAPDLESQRLDVLKRLSETREDSPPFSLSAPVLLLFAVAIVGVAYVASQLLKKNRVK